MSTVNKVILVGHLGADPELRYTTSGKPRCTMRLATHAVFQDQEGQQQRRVCWHRVVTWGKQGESCSTYLRKGRQVYVEGRLDNRSYKDKNGEKQYISEVVASSVVFLGGRQTDSAEGEGLDQGAGAGELVESGGEAPDTRSIPF